MKGVEDAPVQNEKGKLDEDICDNIQPADRISQL